MTLIYQDDDEMKKIIILLGILLSAVPSLSNAGPVVFTVDFLEGANYEKVGNIVLNGDMDFSGDYPVLLSILDGFIQTGGNKYSFATTHFSYDVLQGDSLQSGYSAMSIVGDFTDLNGMSRSAWGNFGGYVDRFVATGLLDSEGFLQFDDQRFTPARLKVDVPEPSGLLLLTLGFSALFVRKALLKVC